ncbi:MAG TPA: contractile injection system protein, VgrG/Pvc8 family [Pyrinomonadaceae bacterium]|jgi:phage protein D
MPAPADNQPLVPEFDVLINGASIAAEVKTHVVGVTVDEHVDWPAMFTLALIASEDLRDAHRWIDDAKLFAVGHEVEVKLGYANQLQSVLKGEITGLEPEYRADQLPALVVRGYDRLHRLLRGRKTRTFVNTKDSDIAARVAQEAGLSADVVDSSVTHDYVLQANQTDLDFLHERARRIQYEVAVADKTLHFRPVGNAESAAVTLALYDDVLEFYPRLSSVGQVSETGVRGWDAKSVKEIVGAGRKGDENSKMGGRATGAELVAGPFGAAVGQTTAWPVKTQGEADQIAKAQLNRRLLELVEGEGVCRGRTDLRAGRVVKLDGAGARFSGQYYLVAVVHRYHPQHSYQTRFTVRRNAA